MEVLRLLAVSILLSSWALCASAEHTPKHQMALAAIPPEFQKLDIWSSVDGDLNGDGFSDLAMVLTGQSRENGPREERLLILTGNPDGSYNVFSVSGEFCHVSKFYNLGVEKKSLFVQGFESTDSARSSSFTLQFRYNAKLKDLELIGEETLSQNYEEDSYYRVSTNYLTKTAIHSRQSGKREKEVVSRLNKAPVIFRLQGFDCSARDSADSSVYIDENFRVQRK